MNTLKPIPKALRLVAYCRGSLTKQEMSPVDQQAKLERWAAVSPEDYKIVEVIHDSESGKDLKRAGIQEALRVMERGDADGIVVVKLDRLSRSVSDMDGLLKTHFAERFQLISLNENIDTSNAMGRMLLGMITLMAQWERETIAERTKDAFAEMKLRGEHTGGNAPYGFAVEKRRDKKKYLVKDSAEMGTVKLILEMVIRDCVSLNGTAKVLNELGITTRVGNAWGAKQVSRVVEYHSK